MLVLVTGAAGLLGRACVTALLCEGHRVRALVRRRSLELDDDRVEVVRGSLSDRTLCNAATDGVDAVIHCAYDFLSDDPVTTNVEHPVGLFTSAAANGVRVFVNVSTVMVYGLEQGAGASHVHEDSPLPQPETALDRYPATKIGLEVALADAARMSRTRLVTVRPGVFFSDSVPPVMRTLNVRGREIGLLVGAGSNRLPFIHVDDVASLTVRALRDGAPLTVHAVPTRPVPAVTFARAWALRNRPTLRVRCVPVAAYTALALGTWAARRTARPPNIRYGIRRATRDLVYDTTRAVRDLSWSDDATHAVLDAPTEAPT